MASSATMAAYRLAASEKKCCSHATGLACFSGLARCLGVNHGANRHGVKRKMSKAETSHFPEAKPPTILMLQAVHGNTPLPTIMSAVPDLVRPNSAKGEQLGDCDVSKPDCAAIPTDVDIVSSKDSVCFEDYQAGQADDNEYTSHWYQYRCHTREEAEEYDATAAEEADAATAAIVSGCAGQSTALQEVLPTYPIENIDDTVDLSPDDRSQIDVLAQEATQWALQAALANAADVPFVQPKNTRFIFDKLVENEPEEVTDVWVDEEAECMLEA